MLRKVRDSSGAKYSVHKETGPSAADQANTSSATVGSNYKPIQTSPKPFSSSNSTTQPPHVAFQQQQQPDTRARLERERREREEKERFEAEQKMARLRLADQEASDRKKREEQQQQKQQYEQELLEKEERERNARGSRVREERERREREEREREAAAFKERENRDRLNEVKRQREVEKASSFTTAAIVPAVAAPGKRNFFLHSDYHVSPNYPHLHLVMPSRPSRQAPPVASTTRIIKVVKAKVLYEYTAAESNEIDLVENEILTDVIQLDEGWWQATKYDGQIGLFPANYVELFEEEVQEKIESVASAVSCYY